MVQQMLLLAVLCSVGTLALSAPSGMLLLQNVNTSQPSRPSFWDQPPRVHRAMEHFTEVPVVPLPCSVPKSFHIITVAGLLLGLLLCF